MQKDVYLVPEHKVIEEVGPKLREFKALATWLVDGGERPNSNLAFSYRIRPSICTRSEAELIGVSSPRFAIRAYVDGSESIFNLRRIDRLSQNTAMVRSHILRRWLYHLARFFRMPNAQRFKHKPMSYRELFQKIQESCCIADSLISPPKRLEKYSFVTCELGLAYGEGKEIHGVPFLQHIGLGGGLCAQAACFTCVALMNRCARSLPCLLYTSPSPRDLSTSRMPSSA